MPKRAPEPPALAATEPGVSEPKSCRFCYEVDPVDDLCEPCGCRGSIGAIHRACLARWQLAVALSERGDLAKANSCGVCKAQFDGTSRLAAKTVALSVFCSRPGMLRWFIQQIPERLIDVCYRAYNNFEIHGWAFLVVLFVVLLEVFDRLLEQPKPLNLAPGVFLVATDVVGTRNIWSESVILLLDYGVGARSRVEGVIVNKPYYGLDVDVHTAFLPQPPADMSEAMLTSRMVPSDPTRTVVRSPQAQTGYPAGSSLLDSTLSVDPWPIGWRGGTDLEASETSRSDQWIEDKSNDHFPAVVRRASFGGPINRQTWTILHNVTSLPDGRPMRRRVAGHQPQTASLGETDTPPWVGAQPTIPDSTSSVVWQEDTVNMSSLLGRLCTRTDSGECDGYCFRDGEIAPGYHSKIRWGTSKYRCQPQREAHARLFAGIAAWGFGQLEGEIRRGVWRIHPNPTAEHIFGRTRPSELHALLMKEVLTGAAGSKHPTNVCVCSMSAGFACSDAVIAGANGEQFVKGGRSDPCWGSMKCAGKDGCIWEQWVPNVHNVKLHGRSPTLIHPVRCTRFAFAHSIQLDLVSQWLSGVRWTTRCGRQKSGVHLRRPR